MNELPTSNERLQSLKRDSNDLWKEVARQLNSGIGVPAVTMNRLHWLAAIQEIEILREERRVAHETTAQEFKCCGCEAVLRITSDQPFHMISWGCLHCRTQNNSPTAIVAEKAVETDDEDKADLLGMAAVVARASREADGIKAELMQRASRALEALADTRQTRRHRGCGPDCGLPAGHLGDHSVGKANEPPTIHMGMDGHPHGGQRNDCPDCPPVKTSSLHEQYPVQGGDILATKPAKYGAADNCEHGIPRQFCTALHDSDPRNAL